MMKKQKKINVYRIMWVSSIFLFLIVVLIMVMDYKINYEYLLESNSKLYFYQCDNELCTTEVEDKDKEIYSAYDCWYEACPVYKSNVNDDHVLLEKDNIIILYNYKTGEEISRDYNNYTFIDNEHIIVEKNEKYGIIDIQNKVIVNLEYDEIGYYEDGLLKGYNTRNIVATKGNKLGIISYKDGSIVESFDYTKDNINELLEIINSQNLT